MTDKETSEKIARYIFSLGDEPKSPCQRIQFQGGIWPNSEKPQGGLCESALAHEIMRAMKKLSTK